MEMFLVSGNSVYYGIAAPVILCGMCSYIPKLRQISEYCKPENFCSTRGTVESINWMCVSCNYNLFFNKRSQQASSIAQTFSSHFSKQISRDERVRPVRLSKVTYYCEWETSLAMIEGKWEKWFKHKLQHNIMHRHNKFTNYVSKLMFVCTCKWGHSILLMVSAMECSELDPETPWCWILSPV